MKVTTPSLSSTSVEEKRKVSTTSNLENDDDDDNNNDDHQPPDSKKVKLDDEKNKNTGSIDNEQPKKKFLSLEELSTEPRVKFQTELIKSSEILPPDEIEWKPLASALQTSEALGAAPVCPREGFVFGNGAVISTCGTNIVVSKSGRLADTDYTKSQFVRVINFNNKTWTATYGGVVIDNDNDDDDKKNSNDIIKPSSDTPLLWNALMVAPKVCKNWSQQPKFVLHGHSCATQEEADVKGFPCSTKETLFSTPADLEALMDLFQQYPYPTYQIYVRKNHGFFLLAQNEQEACTIFREQLAPSKLTTTSSAEPDETHHDKEESNNK